RQLFLPPVGDGDLGRALQRDLALVRLERVGGQSLDEPPTLDPSDRRAPSVPRERAGEASGEGIGGIGPEVLAVVASVDIFLEPERLDGLRVRPVGTATE